MKFETIAASQFPQHYSLIGLMYAHQFKPTIDLQNHTDVPEAPSRADLARHIEDFCDCV
jgi:hypothetical protein